MDIKLFSFRGEKPFIPNKKLQQCVIQINGNPLELNRLKPNMY